MKLFSIVKFFLAQSITEEQIQQGALLLDLFISGAQKLYGPSIMVANVHMLYHIPQCVRRLGPLWVYWCYPFESVLGHLAGYVFGTREPQHSFCFAATANHLHAALECKYGEKGILFGQCELIDEGWITVNEQDLIREVPRSMDLGVQWTWMWGWWMASMDVKGMDVPVGKGVALDSQGCRFNSQ